MDSMGHSFPPFLRPATTPHGGPGLEDKAFATIPPPGSAHKQLIQQQQHHAHHQQSSQHNRSVLLVGNLTLEQLGRVKEAISVALGEEVQSANFPSNGRLDHHQDHSDLKEEDSNSAQDLLHAQTAFLEGLPHSKPAMVQMTAGLDGLCRKLQQIGKLEHKVVKACGAVTHYQKQQQELADNFVRLSNKYQELKANFHLVLWNYMPRLSEFGAIPLIDNSIEETEAQVGSFSVGLLVGKGHFAEVRVCSLVNEDRRLVLKAIDKQRVKNINGLQRISHEIEALSLLHHPNILTLYNVLHGKQSVYLVTERLSSDLYEFIGEHPTGVGESLAKRVICPIVDAIIFIHSKGFVHRDLKPENILLDYQGSSTTENFIIKICDFGLCEKIPADNSPLTEFCGSPGFMCPEMVIVRKYDGKKADLWSIGCILLELLLTAKEFSTLWMKNFQDDSLSDPVRFKRQLYSSWTHLEIALKSKVSEHLFNFVSGLLKVDPALRFSTQDVQRVNLRSGSSGSTTLSSSAASGFAKAPSFAASSSSPAPPPLAKPGLAACPSFGSTTSIRSSGSSSPIHFPCPLQHMDSIGSMDSSFGGLGISQSPKALSSSASLTGPGPLFLERSPASSSSSSSKTFSVSAATSPCNNNNNKGGSGTRTRPHSCKQGSARTSLRAQTLLKLENNDISTYARGRNNNLRPLSPGTPDIASLGISVGGPKKFFEEEVPSSPLNSSAGSTLGLGESQAAVSEAGNVSINNNSNRFSSSPSHRTSV